jgi:hypothetical protein
MPQEDFAFSFDSLTLGDRFIFVPRDSSTTFTASDLLNRVTANFPPVENFINSPFTGVFNTDNPFELRPTVESVNNGDDLLVRFAFEGLVLDVFANADGSATDITIRNEGGDPVDFAELFVPVDPNEEDDYEVLDPIIQFAVFGFVPQNPFAQGDLTQTLDGVDFGGLTVGGGFFGGLFDFGGGQSFNDGNTFGSYDFFGLSGNYDRFEGGGGGGGGGGGSFYDAYSSYDGIDYINLDIWG